MMVGLHPVGSDGPEQPEWHWGSGHATPWHAHAGSETGTGKTGGHYPRSTATAHPPRWSGGFTRTRGRRVVFSEFVLGAQRAHSRGGSATVAFSAISARKTGGHYLIAVGLSRAR